MFFQEPEVVESPDVHFEPIINLPSVVLKTLEEDEEEMLKLRAKLFRYDTESDPREWKERGTGEMKVLKHKKDGVCRILMRRDKTYKICANHLILPEIELKPNCGNEKAWVWSTLSDYSDEEPKPELLAIRFGTVENALKFKEVFEEAKKIAATRQKGNASVSEDVEESQNDEEVKNEDDDEVKNEDGDEVENEDQENEEPESKTEEKDVKNITSDLEKLSVEPSGDE